MEQWIAEILNNPIVVRMLPKLGKEDYDRVLKSAKQYPNCTPEDTRFLLDVLHICAEKIGIV
jgi:hypothetical protein